MQYFDYIHVKIKSNKINLLKKEFNTLEFSLALILNVNMCKIINALNKKKTSINKQKHKNKRSHSLNKGGNFMHYKGACSTIDIL